MRSKNTVNVSLLENNCHMMYFREYSADDDQLIKKICLIME